MTKKLNLLVFYSRMISVKNGKNSKEKPHARLYINDEEIAENYF